MSSNTPPPITPNTNMNADFVPDHTNHPPTENVMTPASQLTQEFNLVFKPAQQRNRDHFREETTLNYVTLMQMYKNMVIAAMCSVESIMILLLSQF